ncbi:MAG: hypothetical protein WCR08_14000, partial [Gammaproteobacteria bacterium]
HNLVKKQVLYTPTHDVIALQSLDQKKYDSITLGLEPFKGVMLAANFLGNVKLRSIEDSYFPKIELNPEQISSKNPLLTTEDSCLRSMAIDFDELTSKLVLITKMRELDKNSFVFNRQPYCNGMRLAPILGFSGTETWGTWSNGDKTEFSIKTSEAYPSGGKLIIAVRPVINPNIAHDQRVILVEVDGKPYKKFSLASSEQTNIEIEFDKKQLGALISVVLKHTNPIKFPDISGNDPRIVSVGFLSAKLMTKADVLFASVTGAYGRENDANDWWYWVKRKVSFKLHPVFVTKNTINTKLRFEYITGGKQTLTLRIIKRNGSTLKILLPSKGNIPTIFEKLIDLPPNEISEISIETDGTALPLSKSDPRVAAWMIRNLDME